MYKTRWKVLEDNDKEHLDEEWVIQTILKNKGIEDENEIKEFLSDRPKKTYDPYLLKNMDEVVEVIIDAIKNDQNIWIYGDYDVDGICSITLLTQFLRHFTKNVHYYIPKRHSEGYGLNKSAIEEIHKKGADILITVDCGITSFEEVEFAKKLGLKVIVTDHHNVSEMLPKCLILNPKQIDCRYPFKSLCGCGVAFKLVQAIQKKLQAPKSYLSELLDVVALATVADVVPLIDENRTLLKYGLLKLNHPTRIGLKYLIQAIGLEDSKISTGHIGFVLGPHFNASGRIDDAKLGVELLLSQDPRRIKELIGHLIDCNDERKDIQQQGLEFCIKKVEKNYQKDLFLVIDSEGIHEGVIGIIAGRIRDLYYKPTLIVTASQEDSILKGSGRSIDDMNIYEVMKRCKDLFVKFGGHKNACGFSIKKENLDTLRMRLNDEARKIYDENKDVFTKKVQVQCRLKPKQLSSHLVEVLEKIEPFGMGNEKPYFLIEDIKVDNEPSHVVMGKNKDHLKLKGICEESQQITAVGFSKADKYIHKLGCPERVEIVGYPNINEWRGSKTVQMMIYDIKASE